MRELILVPIMILTSSLVTTCPFYITNDSDKPIFVVNPHGSQAIFIEPNKMQEIDPTITDKTWWTPWKYLTNETLNFYVSSEQNSSNFILKYQMTEKYCDEYYRTTNQLTLSQIKEFINKPTDRLKTKEIKTQKEHNHTH